MINNVWFCYLSPGHMQVKDGMVTTAAVSSVTLRWQRETQTVDDNRELWVGPKNNLHTEPNKNKPYALVADGLQSCQRCSCWLPLCSWCGLEAALPTACLPVSPSECTGAWECRTTWRSFPTWWTTTTRTSLLLLWRWEVTMGPQVGHCNFSLYSFVCTHCIYINICVVDYFFLFHFSFYLSKVVQQLALFAVTAVTLVLLVPQ